MFHVRVLGIFTANTLAQILSLVSIALVARSVGPAQFGILSGALAIIAIVSDVSDLGVNTFTLRAISTEIWSVQEALELHLQRALRVLFIVAIGWVSVTLVCDIGSAFVLPLALYVLSFPMNLGLSCISRGAGLFRLITVLTIVEKLLLLAACVSGRLVGGPMLVWFSLGIGCASALSAASYLLFLRRSYPKGAGARGPTQLTLASVYLKSRHLGLANIATDLNIAEVPLVAAFAGTRVAGEFAAATRMSGPLGMPFSALSLVLLPDVVRARAQLLTNGLIRKCAPVVIASAFGLALVAAFAPALTRAALGDSYGSSTSDALRIVCATTFMGGLSQIIYTVLQATFQERVMSRMLIATVLLGLLLTTAGGYYGGAVLAATGGMVAQAIPLTLLAARYRAVFSGRRPSSPGRH